LAIAGFEKFLVKGDLKFRSHDANKTGCALPTSQTGVDRRVHLNLFGERGVHFLRAQ
jgi:hypothetical protein